MAEGGRGRSRTPKSLTASPKRPSKDKDVSMARSRSRSSLSRSRSRSRSRSTNAHDKTMKGAKSDEVGFRVIVVSGLTKNVMKGHLEEIFGEYGRVTGLDLPLFKVCELFQLANKYVYQYVYRKRGSEALTVSSRPQSRESSIGILETYRS
jgi:RNA recognition motif-containing protein